MQDQRDPAVAYRLAEAPVLADLHAAGIPVQSLEELVPGRSEVVYKNAIPVLLRWLPMVAEGRVKWTIASALAVPWAKKSALGPLIDEFRAWGGETPTKDGLGFAIAKLANDDRFDEIAGLIRDRSHGTSRVTVFRVMVKSKRPEATQILLDATTDPQLLVGAVIALGKRKDALAVPRLREILATADRRLASEIKAALRRIGDRA